MNEGDQRLPYSMAKLGFPIMEPVQDLDLIQTLAEVIKSNELRYWEGFPVLLANAADDYHFTPDLVEELLETETQRERFHSLILLSGLIFSQYHLSFAWWRQFKKDLTNEDKNKLKTWRNSLIHDQKLKWNGVEFDPQRVKKLFELYFGTKAEKAERQKQKYEELSLEFALSRIFSPKQKELFKKKLSGLPLNKTEKEYYSRVVKKKIIALANNQLHSLAVRLLEQ